MIDINRLKQLLSRLDGEGYCGREARDRAIVQLQAAGPDHLFPLLIPMLSDPNGETRCLACEGILWVNPKQGLPLVLPLLHDSEDYVRLSVCELLYVFGGEETTETLVSVLRNDPDAQVRGMAAGILGAIGSPEAIPPLITAMDFDHEFDMHGHSPSSCATSALDLMLGTDETCLHFENGLCKMKGEEPDLERLRKLAQEKYERWSNERNSLRA